MEPVGSTKQLEEPISDFRLLKSWQIFKLLPVGQLTDINNKRFKINVMRRKSHIDCFNNEINNLDRLKEFRLQFDCNLSLNDEPIKLRTYKAIVDLVDSDTDYGEKEATILTALLLVHISNRMDRVQSLVGQNPPFAIQLNGSEVLVYYPF